MSTTVSALRRATILALVALLAVAAGAACKERTPRPVVGAEVYRATGKIVWVSFETNTVKIDHDEIKGLMPAMSMKFPVREPSMLEGLEPNDRVEFGIVEEDFGYTITEIKKAPAS